jgi:hypothetical protein
MTEIVGDSMEDAFVALRTRADALERQLQDVERNAALQLRQSELKAEALRAGIVDVDGLRLIDPSSLEGRHGGDFDAASLVDRLRRDKPWLFGAGNSSSASTAPPAVPAKRRLAMDMSVDEWRAARADLLRRR